MNATFDEKMNSISSDIELGDKAFKAGQNLEALNCYLNVAASVVDLRFHTQVGEKIRSITIYDIDGDGVDEIIFGTDGNHLYVWSVNLSKMLWAFSGFDWVVGITVVDINDDGIDEVVVASDKLYILDKNGQRLKELQTGSAISAMQINASQKIIVVGDKSGQLKCYNFDFSERWFNPFKTNGQIIDIATGDYDGDGDVEIAIASEDKNVYILDNMGHEKDKVNVKHWIVNLADCKMFDSQLRLYIGKFAGDLLVYKHKQTMQVASLKQSGILDLKAEYLFDSLNPCFIVGSSDRELSIFSHSGELLWAIESGLGQRALCIKKEDKELLIYVGTESGEIFYYSVYLVKELVAKIRESFSRLNIDLLDLQIDQSRLGILRNFIEYNPIKNDATKKCVADMDNSDTAISNAMEVWFNNCAYGWTFETKGRVQGLARFNKNNEMHNLIASDDGNLYCLDSSGKEQWRFSTRSDLSGKSQGVRGVSVGGIGKDSKIFVASADKSLYCLDDNGNPIWNFYHGDWVLFVTSAYCNAIHDVIVLAGTEDGYLLVFNSEGKLLWRKKHRERVRATTFFENENNQQFILVGCDDTFVYIYNLQSELIGKFKTPHYVLVVEMVQQLECNDYVIFVGSEDGNLHAYGLDGVHLWRFSTGSWIAALSIKRTKDSYEIVIGSQDNNMYAINPHGALLWQYEANARVRIISTQEFTNSVLFGSYDKNAYMLEEFNRDIAQEKLSELYSKIMQNGTSFLESASKHSNRYLRAFRFLFLDDLEQLKKGLDEHSEIVLAAIGANLIENFMSSGAIVEEFLVKIISTTTRRVAALLFKKLISSNIKRFRVSKIVRGVIQSKGAAEIKIEIFRQWLTISTQSSEVLSATYILCCQNDNSQAITEEIIHGCARAFQLFSGNEADMSIEEHITAIAGRIGEINPKVVLDLKKIYGIE